MPTRECRVCGESKELSLENFKLRDVKRFIFRNECKLCSNAADRKREAVKFASSRRKKQDREIEQEAMHSIGKRKCSNCLEVKSEDDFGLQPKGKYGLKSRCKACIAKLKTKSTPEQLERANYLRRFRKYGLTEEQYLKLISDSGNKCMICSKEFKTATDAFIDHCHSTGLVRGVLCSSCNSGLGFFKDSSLLLSKANNYILGSKDKLR